jgi:signal transduction histidine kinase
VDSLEIMSLVLAGAWTVAAIVTARSTADHRRSATLACLAPAATQALALWPPLAPGVLAAWLGYALSLPDGRLRSTARRSTVAAAVVAAAASSVAFAAADHDPSRPIFFALAAGVAAIGVGGAAVRYRRGAEQRVTMQWIAAAGVLSVGYLIVCAVLHLMTGAPHALSVWLAAALVAIPVGHILAIVVPADRAAGWILRQSVGAAGAAVVVSLAYLVIVMGIEGPPKGHERDVLLASLAAAIVGALLAQPVRVRMMAYAAALIGVADRSTEEVVTTFEARMSRAVPMDELLLQLAESLRATVARGGAEIWTGTSGVLARAVSVPNRPPARIDLAERERSVVASARIGGPGWTAVWLPQLPDGATSETAADADLRVVPIAHLGELHGLIVVRRRPEDGGYSEDDERALVDVARQLGLALHNVRLDSALQASLAELAERNEELQASRLRIVAAADASRREIERNLHDGAQQHLVALAVKLGLAGQIAEDGDTATVLAMLEGLRGDVQTTIGELRELAHGIYPPLLRDRGLAEALRTAAIRCPLPTTVDVDLPGRYAEAVETAAYFCCLEAMQNAGKYAGDGATISVDVRGDEASLHFELVDDGVGFDTSTTELGHGFVNMRDRLGAIGGELTVESAPGKGTTVRATIPATPRS